MDKQFLLTLVFISTFLTTSTLNLKAMEAQVSTCLQTCINAWKAQSTACLTQFKENKEHYWACINSIGNEKLACDQECNKR